MESLYLGVDVSETSLRAGLFDARGVRVGLGSSSIRIFRPEEGLVEQSSEDIWRAVAIAVRAALGEAGAEPGRVAGIGFDACSSLVALDAAGRPVSVSPTGHDEQNVIAGSDQRAAEQGGLIDRTQHEVLRYESGAISAEMQIAKLIWLRERLPDAFHRASHFFDLADFLGFRATGSLARSLSTTTGRWTYLGHNGGRWADDFLSVMGLSELSKEGHARIGKTVLPAGERLGGLSPSAAADLGLAPQTAVGVGMVDTHAGGLGLLGTPIDGGVSLVDFETRLALIAGASSCHLALARQPRFVRGFLGPHFSAIVPDMWLSEGGQPATGALIDHLVHSHVRGRELVERAEREHTTVYALLNAVLDELAPERQHALTKELHVYPAFQGNRSPFADPNLRGMVSGLTLSENVESLAVLYLATVQAIAHGTRHIVTALNKQGYRINTLVAAGKELENPVFVREHADATDCRVVLPREPEIVLLGAAMLGAVASGCHASLAEAMNAMSEKRSVIEPQGGQVARYHEHKHAVFLRMIDDQDAYQALMM